MSSDEIKDDGPRKKSTVDILDFLTELPDDVRLEIISLLCIKDAVRTCVLSKKWFSLWTSLSKFTFTAKKQSTSIENYVLFVDNVVSRALSPKITTFVIEGGEIFRYDSHIKDWLNFAIQRKVEELVCISDSRARICEIPENFFDCSSLIKLHMRGLFFRDAIPPWNWQFLKIIQLGFVPLDDLNVSSLLSGCPMLESMELYSVNGLNSLLIGSKKLKSLILKNPQNDTGNLEINAPYLEYLNIAGNLRDLQCRLLDVSALATAKLTFRVVCGLELGYKMPDCHKYHETFITLIQQNIGKLRSAKEITMGAWFFEAPCMLQQVKELPDLDLKWTRLTLDLFLDDFNVNGVADLIGAATCVETLNINIKTSRFGRYHCKYDRDNTDLCSSVVLPNLKNVKIDSQVHECLNVATAPKWFSRSTPDTEHGFNKLRQLLEILLKNALTLEELIVLTKETLCKKCRKNCGCVFFQRLCAELENIPSSSTDSKINLQLVNNS